MITFKQYLQEHFDPQHAESKWKVTYDMYGSNKEVPLSSMSKTVYAGSEQEAIAQVKKLVGGRDHKAEKLRGPIED